MKVDTNKVFDSALARFTTKYATAMAKLIKHREELMAFYDFTAEHWISIRTSNPIESAFATVRLRSRSARNCGSRETTLAMVLKSLQSAQKRWNRLQGFSLLSDVRFEDRLQVVENLNRDIA